MSEATAALTGDNGGTESGAAGQSSAPATAPAWNEGFDEETSAFVTNKGWQGVGDVLSSYRNLEKFAGGSKSLVELPGMDADEETLGNFYNKLGRPADADKYGIKVPEGGDAEMGKWFKDTAFKAGLTDKQATTLFESFNQMSESKMEAMTGEMAQQSSEEIEGLKREWGQAFNDNLASGRRAVQALGYDEKSLSNLEDRLGTGEMLKLFAMVGSKMGEPEFEGSQREGGSFGLTPASAQQQITDLKMDKQFMNEYLNGNKEALAKMKRLTEAAYA